MEDLINFKVVLDSDGFVMMDGVMVLLENLSTGAITKCNYEDVSEFYNLAETSNNNLDCNNSFYQSNSNHLPEPDELQPGPSGNNNGSVKWTTGPTKYLLELYAELNKCVGPLKKFRTKKLMWVQMASDISSKFGMTVNATQVETRYKCVMKRTKKAIDNNHTSGAVRIDTEYDEEIRTIVENDDSLCPEYVLSQGRYAKKARITSSSESTSSTPTSISPTPPTSISQTPTTSISQTPTTSVVAPLTSTPQPSSILTPALSTELTDEELLEPSTSRRQVKKTLREQLFEKYMAKKEEANNMKMKLKTEHHEEKMKLIRELVDELKK